MTIDISTPDGSSFQFPDGTPQETIKGALDKHFGAAKDATSPIGLNDVVRSAATGVPIIGGLLNKAEAATNAALAPLVDPLLPDSFEKLPEGTWGERYKHALDIQNRKDEKFQGEHPIASTAAEIGGGVAATLPLAATGVGAKLLGLSAKTLPGQVGAGAVSGAGINALDAMARGGDPMQGAEVGGGLGAVAPVAGRIAGAVMAPVINAARGIINPSEEAARRVGGMIARDRKAGSAGLTDAEFADAQAAGHPVNAMELGGEGTRALARSSANTSPEGREILNREINDRFESQSTRLSDWLRSTFHYPNAVEQQAALDKLASTTNKAAYDRTYALPHAQSLWDEGFEQISQAPEVQAAIRKASLTAASDTAKQGFTPIQHPFAMDPASGRMLPRPLPDGSVPSSPNLAVGVPSPPNLAFWDHVKRNLDAVGTRESRDWAKILRTRLDSLVPEYGQARAGAASFFGAENALEAGQNFVSSKLGNREARLAVAKMSDQEKQLFQDGFVDRFVQQMREVPDRRSVLNDMSGSPAKVERLHIALGPEKAGQLEAMLHIEKLMDLARPAVQGNSTTARQLAELGLAGGAGTVLGGGNPLDPQSMVSAALIYGAARGRGAINERVAKQVATLLASNDPTKVSQAMRMAGQSKVLGALRRTDAALARSTGVALSAPSSDQQVH